MFQAKFEKLWFQAKFEKLLRWSISIFREVGEDLFIKTTVKAFYINQDSYHF